MFFDAEYTVPQHLFCGRDAMLPPALPAAMQTRAKVQQREHVVSVRGNPQPSQGTALLSYLQHAAYVLIGYTTP